MSISNSQLAAIASRFFDRNRANHYGHPSHLAVKALEHAQKIYERFDNDGLFFGVEGDADYDLTYLNAGDTYTETVVFHDGKFLATSWGDIVEAVDADREGAEV